LHPSAAVPGPDGSDAVKKILGSVSGIAIGLAGLRNRGYGTGHGPAQAPSGLGARHAHLAVNAAFTWCQLMLDTLADPKAPWRKTAAQSALASILGQIIELRSVGRRRWSGACAKVSSDAGGGPFSRKSRMWISLILVTFAIQCPNSAGRHH
jgi:Abortive infection C-terminus